MIDFGENTGLWAALLLFIFTGSGVLHLAYGKTLFGKGGIQIAADSSVDTDSESVPSSKKENKKGKSSKKRSKKASKAVPFPADDQTVSSNFDDDKPSSFDPVSAYAQLAVSKNALVERNRKKVDGKSTKLLRSNQHPAVQKSKGKKGDTLVNNASSCEADLVSDATLRRTDAETRQPETVVKPKRPKKNALQSKATDSNTAKSKGNEKKSKQSVSEEKTAVEIDEWVCAGKTGRHGAAIVEEEVDVKDRALSPVAIKTRERGLSTREGDCSKAHWKSAFNSRLNSLNDRENGFEASAALASFYHLKQTLIGGDTNATKDKRDSKGSPPCLPLKVSCEDKDLLSITREHNIVTSQIQDEFVKYGEWAKAGNSGLPSGQSFKLSMNEVDVARRPSKDGVGRKSSFDFLHSRHAHVEEELLVQPTEKDEGLIGVRRYDKQDKPFHQHPDPSFLVQKRSDAKIEQTEERPCSLVSDSAVSDDYCVIDTVTSCSSQGKQPAANEGAALPKSAVTSDYNSIERSLIFNNNTKKGEPARPFGGEYDALASTFPLASGVQNEFDDCTPDYAIIAHSVTTPNERFHMSPSMMGKFVSSIDAGLSDEEYDDKPIDTLTFHSARDHHHFPNQAVSLERCESTGHDDETFPSGPFVAVADDVICSGDVMPEDWTLSSLPHINQDSISDGFPSYKLDRRYVEANVIKSHGIDSSTVYQSRSTSRRTATNAPVQTGVDSHTFVRAN